MEGIVDKVAHTLPSALPELILNGTSEDRLSRSCVGHSGRRCGGSGGSDSGAGTRAVVRRRVVAVRGVRWVETGRFGGNRSLGESDGVRVACVDRACRNSRV